MVDKSTLRGFKYIYIRTRVGSPTAKIKLNHMYSTQEAINSIVAVCKSAERLKWCFLAYASALSRKSAETEILIRFVSEPKSLMIPSAEISSSIYNPSS